MVEAGGVEPPSEETHGQEPTCLARSLPAFAGGPLERASTNRLLASAPRRALAQNPEAADPKPSRQSTPRSLMRA